MKRIITFLLACLLSCICVFGVGCGNDSKTIRVCASELPHAEILEECVAGILKEKGYKLEVKVLDWTMQNDAVANGDYDANYFQHVPYLETYEGATELFATCKVHYEPLGIYRGKATGGLESGKTFAICNDVSNAIRALELLKAKGVLSTIPVEGESLSFNGSSWTNGDVTIKLVEENLLVSAMADNDFVCLPCNTAMTGSVDQSKKVAQEDDADLVQGKANVLAARKSDYNNDAEYKAKIDVLTDALLSKEVSDFVAQKYSGVITCDSSSQIDLR